METYRTTRCSAFAHPEVTIQLAEHSPIPDVHRILIDYFESAVAKGARFLPGQTVQLGWATLRLCERDDGTIGVQERELVPGENWVESVDHALQDLWFQKEVVASVGLLDELSFPSQLQAVMVADCAANARQLIMTRTSADDLPDDFSGWAVSCAGDHDHGERQFVPLLALAALQPGLVQLLALPHDTAVFVSYREKADAPTGMLRIEPRVFRNGAELRPGSGSYLAALQG